MKKIKEPKEDQKIPFDDALRRLVNTPPKHKPAKKKPGLKRQK